MKLEPDSLNIELTPSPFSWRSQRVFIFCSALIALEVVWPTSIALAVVTVILGTPLFWFVFASSIVHRALGGLPAFFRFMARIVVFYGAAKLLLWFVDSAALLWGGYVSA